MATPVLAVGSTLFLRPEDTAQDVSKGFYARVVTLLVDQVVFEAAETGTQVGNEAISSSIATRRLVPNDEAAGSQVSAWLRQGVAFLHDGDVHFGQVTDTSVLGIEIFSSLGMLWKARSDVVCTVNTLYAMLMFDVAVPPTTWTEAFIRESMARLDKCLAEANECPSGADVMSAIGGLEAFSPDGALRKWREARTGRVRLTTTDHALLFTYYVGGGRTMSEGVRLIVGNSIEDDPVQALSQAAPTEKGPKSKRPRIERSYLASETSYDGPEETKESEPPREQPRPQAHARRLDHGARERQLQLRQQSSAGLSAAAAFGLEDTSSAAVGVVTALQAAATLRARLADNHELLDLLRVATASNEDDDSNNRGRGIYKPGSATRRLHEGVTAPEFQGTSAHSFVLRVAVSAALQCYPYPSIIVLLYHLAFGRPGLSIMHLCSITFLESMVLQESNVVNMMDYGAHITVPAARKPNGWVDVQDAVNGLVLYCTSFTDSTTIQLAVAIARFVAAMQAQGHWPESHLPALVFWINGRLEAYRALVVQCLHDGSADPSVAVTWFTTSNPELVPVQNTMIRSEINALHAARQSNLGHRAQHQQQLTQHHQQQQQPRHGSTASNAAALARSSMPADVAASIPSRQNQDLCLRFASRRGCRVAGATCGFGERTRGHFVDQNLPRNVRAYIVTKFGGLSADYTSTN